MTLTQTPMILTHLTISECMSSKSAGALVAGATTGLTVHSLTLVKKLAAVIHGGFITQGQFALSIAAVAVTAAILVSLLMVFLNAGFILLDTELKHAKMVKTVRGKFVSLHTLLVN